MKELKSGGYIHRSKLDTDFTWLVLCRLGAFKLKSAVSCIFG